MKFNLFESLLQVFYPHLCHVCSSSIVSAEQFICQSCLADIPRTNYHLVENNPVEKRFWGKADVFKATSFFFFAKGSNYRVLLHELKYRNNPEIGRYLGQLAGAEMIGSWLNEVDIVVPVPLHPKKLALRGYNQSEYIAKGLATTINARCINNLIIRNKANATQTKKSVYERFENTDGIFSFATEFDLANKHILIVDDILTTGSTIEACVRCIPKFDGLRVSVFTLAIA